jgi:hypothetical protein
VIGWRREEIPAAIWNKRARARSGKSARIKEKLDYKSAKKLG